MVMIMVRGTVLRLLFAGVMFAFTAPWATYAGELSPAQAAFELGDYPRALRLYEIAAERGDVEATYRLGEMYAQGLGAEQDFRAAAERFRIAADLGHAEARARLGELLFQGLGVARDLDEAVRLTRLAADQGVASAQYRTGLVHQYGQRVATDYAEAAYWFGLASRARFEPAHGAYAALVDQLDAATRALIERRIDAYTPVAGPEAALVSAPMLAEKKSSGTGFVVSRDGHVLTSAHVVAACPGAVLSARAGIEPLEIVAIDRGNDLALLVGAGPQPHAARFAAGAPRPGEPVIVVGYPLQGLLASEAHVTTGTLSASKGLGDDPRLLQITAPVQRGNSGGPIFDASGAVAGVVMSKLDALRIAQSTGDIPQNVNFGVKASVVVGFLAQHGIAAAIERTDAPDRTPAEIGALGAALTLPIECWH